VRQRSTMFASATAAALAALAVTVAVPAIGDEGPRDPGEPAAPIKVDGPPPPELRELRACLVKHGAQIESTGPTAIKRWIGEHADDPAARDALKACHVALPDEKHAIVCKGDGAPPPGTEELRVPGDKPKPTAPQAPPSEL
jgi:hypothetical protein